METAQATALDEVIFGLHADLAARLTQRTDADHRHFTAVMGQLGRVLDRLPPGPAGLGEIAMYLGTLITGLNADPWPRDRQFAGPALTPAVIELQLKITNVHMKAGKDLDADELARRCTRLVVLGDPGSGKTWLAKRTARLCAEDALEALSAGDSLDEVELPLYTNCSRLFNTSGDIRHAAVSSALDQLGDLGGSRISAALQAFFAERNAPTLLVIDSLDEARGPDERLRQADTLPWRIVLTTRPNRWNQQLDISQGDDLRRAGTLQPLRYPDDLEHFIARWFAQRPNWGKDLATQIARRPALQQAATVPLILAFYCILGADQQLPNSRCDLYTKVLRRMLTGRWRNGGDGEPDGDACLRTLRAWAWSGAVSDPVSGIGTWADDIPTQRASLDHADQEALNHVATPLGPPDLDTGIVLRRFMHRSLCEHLVADYIAGLTVDQAAGELLGHIWYDTDWEYAAPAAVAMHPQRDRLLKELLCRAGIPGLTPEDIPAIDRIWEVRKFLTRLARESSEADWSAEAAAIISRARVDLATSRHLGELGMAATGWGASNGQAREILLRLLAQETDSREAMALAEAAVGLDPTTQQREQVREALLGRLAQETKSWEAKALAEAVAGLDPTTQQREQVREALLGRLAQETHYYYAGMLADAVAGLAPTDKERAHLRVALLTVLGTTRHHRLARQLAAAVAGLHPTDEERDRARESLLGLLATSLDPTTARLLAHAVVGFAVTAGERTRILAVLLGWLTEEVDKIHRVEAKALAEAVVVGFPLAATDREQLQEAMLDQLSRATGGAAAGWMAEPVAALAVTAEERARVREMLLGLLTRETGRWAVRRLALAVAGLDPTDEERNQACEVLLGQLVRDMRSTEAEILVYAMTRLDPTMEKRGQVRSALLRLLARETDSGFVGALAKSMAGLAVIPEEQEQVREELQDLLARETRWSAATSMTEAMASLDPTAQERARAREALLRLLAQETDSEHVGALAKAVAGLAVTAEEQEQVREVLVGLLAQETRWPAATSMTHAVVGLDPTVPERAQVREALLGLLARETDSQDARVMAEKVAGLDPTAQERGKVRVALLGLLARETNSWQASSLMEAVARFDPSLDDVSKWRSWAAPPPTTMLAAVRRNSEISAWLAALPWL
jgi:hypothetical protein